VLSDGDLCPPLRIDPPWSPFPSSSPTFAPAPANPEPSSEHASFAPDERAPTAEEVVEEDGRLDPGEGREQGGEEGRRGVVRGRRGVGQGRKLRVEGVDGEEGEDEVLEVEVVSERVEGLVGYDG
jgi:hypothetical protein